MLKRHFPLLITIAVFFLGYFFCMLEFPAFLTTRVIANILTDNAFLGILAVGMTFVILSGGIDLSVGSVVAFTGVLLATLIGQWGIPPYIAMGIALIMGALFGGLMGWIIDTLKIPAFIVTLAGMFFVRGISFLISEQSLAIEHPVYRELSRTTWHMVGGGRLSLIAVIMLLIVIVGMLIAHRTRFGNNVYAIGGNATSAALMGVDVKRTTIGVYMLSSFLATCAGIVFSIYTSAGYPLAAIGVELDAIAAVVIGGTLLSGGVGTVLGSLFGVLIQGLIQTYITFDGTLSSWWTKIIVGVLLFSFIALQRLLLMLNERRKVVNTSLPKISAINQ